MQSSAGLHLIAILGEEGSLSIVRLLGFGIHAVGVLALLIDLPVFRVLPVASASNYRKMAALPPSPTWASTGT